MTSRKTHELLNRLHAISLEEKTIDELMQATLDETGSFLKVDYAKFLSVKGDSLEFWKGYCREEDRRKFWDKRRIAMCNVPVASFKEQDLITQDQRSISGHVAATGNHIIIPDLRKSKLRDYFLVTEENVLGEIVLPIFSARTELDEPQIRKVMAVLCLDYIAPIKEPEITAEESEKVSLFLSVVLQNFLLLQIKKDEISFDKENAALVRNIRNGAVWRSLLWNVFKTILDLAKASLVLFWQLEPSGKYLILQASSEQASNLPLTRLIQHYDGINLTEAETPIYIYEAVIDDIKILQQTEKKYSELIFPLKDGNKRGYVDFYFTPPNQQKRDQMHIISSYVESLSTGWLFWQLAQKEGSLTEVIRILDRVQIHSLSERTFDAICAQLLKSLPFEASSIWLRETDTQLETLSLRASTHENWEIKGERTNRIQGRDLKSLTHSLMTENRYFVYFPEGSKEQIEEILPICCHLTPKSLLASPIIERARSEFPNASELRGLVICQNKKGGGPFVRYLQEEDKEVVDTLTSLILLLDKIEDISQRERIVGSITAHEINSPLEVISSGIAYLKLITTPLKDSEQDAKFRYKNIEETLQLISFVAAQGTFTDPDWEPKDERRLKLLPLVAGVVNMLRGYALKKSGNVDIYYDPNIEEIEGKILDENAFKQVLYNLIINAIKYSDRDSEITICKRKPPKGFSDCLAIENKGFGISETEEPHIFRIGYRGPEARKRGIGHGKGLFIVKKIMRAMNGDVVLIRRKDPTIFGIVFRI